MPKPLKVNWKRIAEDAQSRVSLLQQQLLEMQTSKNYWLQQTERLRQNQSNQEVQIERLRSDQAIDEATLIKQRERLIKLTGIKNRCDAVMQAVRQIFYTNQSTFELDGTAWKKVWSTKASLDSLEIYMLGLDTQISELEVDDAIPQTPKNRP